VLEQPGISPWSRRCIVSERVCLWCGGDGGHGVDAGECLACDGSGRRYYVHGQFVPTDV
jgi:hypothetical protein